MREKHELQISVKDRSIADHLDATQAPTPGWPSTGCERPSKSYSIHLSVLSQFHQKSDHSPECQNAVRIHQNLEFLGNLMKPALFRVSECPGFFHQHWWKILWEEEELEELEETPK